MTQPEKAGLMLIGGSLGLVIGVLIAVGVTILDDTGKR